MKKLFLTLIICLNFFTGCTSQKSRMKDLWNIEKTINYQQFTKSEEEKINKLLEAFSQEEKYNKDLWSSGYSQQCYVLRKLYYEEIISMEDFLNRCISIYERYEKNRNHISIHTVGFAVCLYYHGEIEKANDLFVKILNNVSEKDFTSKSDYEISLFICRKLSNTNPEISSNEFYSNMTDEDIINTFCGF